MGDMEDTNDLLFEIADDLNWYLDLSQLTTLSTVSTKTFFRGLNNMRYNRYTPLENGKEIIRKLTDGEPVKLSEIRGSANASMVEVEGNTSLHLMIHKNNVDMFKLLLEEGVVFTDIQTEYTFSSSEVFESNIIDGGYSQMNAYYPNFIDENGETQPLPMISSDNIERVKLLIKMGADVNIGGMSEHTPLEMAAWNYDIEMAKLLIKEGANVNLFNGGHTAAPIHHASSKNNIELVKFLIKEGADAKIVTEVGVDAIQFAVWENNIEIIKLLISEGVDVKTVDNFGRNPVFEAVNDDRDRIELVRFLIKEGAPVNIVNFQGQTAIYRAVLKDNIEMAELLIENGILLNIADIDRRTPIFHAVWNENIDMAKLLIENGALANITDMTGRSPLEEARIESYTEIIQLLEEAIERETQLEQ